MVYFTLYFIFLFFRSRFLGSYGFRKCKTETMPSTLSDLHSLRILSENPRWYQQLFAFDRLICSRRFKRVEAVINVKLILVRVHIYILTDIDVIFFIAFNFTRLRSFLYIQKYMRSRVTMFGRKNIVQICLFVYLFLLINRDNVMCYLIVNFRLTIVDIP